MMAPVIPYFFFPVGQRGCVTKCVHFQKILVLDGEPFFIYSLYWLLWAQPQGDSLSCAVVAQQGHTQPHACSQMMLLRVCSSHLSPVSWRISRTIRGSEKFCCKSNLLNFVQPSFTQTHLANELLFSGNTVRNPVSSCSVDHTLGNGDFELRKCIQSRENLLRRMWIPVFYFALITNIDTFQMFTGIGYFDSW